MKNTYSSIIQNKKWVRSSIIVVALGIVGTWLIISIACVVCVVSSYFGGSSNIEPTPNSPHMVLENTLFFDEIWRKSDVHLISHDPPNITGAEGSVIFANRVNNLSSINIQSLNAKDGTFRWEIKGLYDVYGLTSDPQGVFIAVPYTINKYDLMKGDFIWKTKIFSTNKIYKLDPGDTSISVYLQEHSNGQWIQYLQSITNETGLLTELLRKEIPSNTTLLLRSNGIDYWASKDTLSALEQSSSGIKWSTPIKDPSYCLLTSSGSVIVLSGIGWMNLLSLNNNDGSILWQYQTPIVSNFVLVENTIYAITETGELVAIDLKTGSEKGHIRFSQLSDLKTSISSAYYVAITEDILVTYYGDSQELIAFRINKQ